MGCSCLCGWEIYDLAADSQKSSHRGEGKEGESKSLALFSLDKIQKAPSEILPPLCSGGSKPDMGPDRQLKQTDC